MTSLWQTFKLGLLAIAVICSVFLLMVIPAFIGGLIAGETGQIIGAFSLVTPLALGGVLEAINS